MDTPKKHTRSWRIAWSNRVSLFLSVLLLAVMVCAGAPKAYANEPDAAAGEAEVTIRVRTVLENMPLLDDTFEFALVDSAGTHLQTAYNAGDGSVTFEPLSFTPDDLDRNPDAGDPAATTLAYAVTEATGTDDEMLYCTGVVRATVTLTPQSDGALVAEVSYAYSDDGQNFEATSDPCFANRYSTITIHTVKRMREEPHDPLPGVHLGLWMVNPEGEDFYLGLGRNQEEKEGSECESSNDGDLYFDVPRIMGVAFYFLEEWPPPAGHLVDPYPSDYFTLVIEGDSYRIVYESDPDYSQYMPDDVSVTPPGRPPTKPTPSPTDPIPADPTDPPSEDDDDPSQAQPSDADSPTNDEPDPVSPTPTSDDDTSAPDAEQPDPVGTTDETPATPVAPSTDSTPEGTDEATAPAQQPSACPPTRPVTNTSQPSNGASEVAAAAQRPNDNPASKTKEEGITTAPTSQVSAPRITNTSSSQTAPARTRPAGIARILPFVLCGLLILLGAIAAAAYLRMAARDDR